VSIVSNCDCFGGYIKQDEKYHFLLQIFYMVDEFIQVLVIKDCYL